MINIIIIKCFTDVNSFYKSDRSIIVMHYFSLEHVFGRHSQNLLSAFVDD